MSGDKSVEYEPSTVTTDTYLLGPNCYIGVGPHAAHERTNCPWGSSCSDLQRHSCPTKCCACFCHQGRALGFHASRHVFRRSQFCFFYTGPVCSQDALPGLRTGGLASGPILAATIASAHEDYKGMNYMRCILSRPPI